MVVAVAGVVEAIVGVMEAIAGVVGFVVAVVVCAVGVMIAVVFARCSDCHWLRVVFSRVIALGEGIKQCSPCVGIRTFPHLPAPQASHNLRFTSLPPPPRPLTTPSPTPTPLPSPTSASHAL